MILKNKKEGDDKAMSKSTKFENYNFEKGNKITINSSETVFSNCSFNETEIYISDYKSDKKEHEKIINFAKGAFKIAGAIIDFFNNAKAS